MILFRDCLAVANPDARKLPTAEAAGADARGADILVEGNRIAKIGKNLVAPANARVVEASGCVAVPGFVNTHHHFYQTLTRNVPPVQDAKLFDWLVNLYEIWKGIDEEAVYVSSKLALAELAMTGCTCSTDHHYLYPRGFRDDLMGLQFKAAEELGIRFSPTRGSMSRSKKDGGLPPDSVVQTDDEILADSERVVAKYHDASPASMRRIALAPCSPFSVSEDLMKRTADLARTKGVRLHTHLCETEDEQEYCVQVYGRRPLDLMKDTGFVGEDTWYAHGIWFNDEELRYLATTKTGVAHCPSSNMRLGSGICRVREMLDLGVPVGLAVDGSASNDCSDMALEARQALLLQRVRYGSAGLNAREALHVATAGGARILGWNEAGELREGMLADIALFDLTAFEYAGSWSDPVAALLFCGVDRKARWVVANGEFVVDDRKLVGCDAETLAEDARRVSAKLLAKAGLKG